MGVSKEKYGVMEELLKKDISGLTIEVNHMGENRTYWVPSGGATVGGKGLQKSISISLAYRVFDKSRKSISVRMVNDSFERSVIVMGLWKKVEAYLQG